MPFKWWFWHKRKNCWYWGPTEETGIILGINKHRQSQSKQRQSPTYNEPHLNRLCGYQTWTFSTAYSTRVSTILGFSTLWNQIQDCQNRCVKAYPRNRPLAGVNTFHCHELQHRPFVLHDIMSVWVLLPPRSKHDDVIKWNILGRELGPSGVSPNQRSRWKHAFSPLKHV